MSTLHERQEKWKAKTMDTFHHLEYITFNDIDFKTTYNTDLSMGEDLSFYCTSSYNWLMNANMTRKHIHLVADFKLSILDFSEEFNIILSDLNDTIFKTNQIMVDDVLINEVAKLLADFYANIEHSKSLLNCSRYFYGNNLIFKFNKKNGKFEELCLNIDIHDNDDVGFPLFTYSISKEKNKLHFGSLTSMGNNHYYRESDHLEDNSSLVNALIYKIFKNKLENEFLVKNINNDNVFEYNKLVDILLI